ncbi:MAG: Hsp20 family protein [Kiloniellales bacterium]|jgi:molecular chaperone IbpA|nr:Hsp20 family protein [Kiloniellales bacterium]
MRSVDLSPLMRATVGFDRMMNLLDAQTRLDQGDGYPPYNIEKLGEDSYRITMAVAGFGEADLDVTVKENSLTIKGKKAEAEPDKVKYLYRGIATRSFERRFELADHIKVTGARLDNGVLSLELVREVPEAMKPRTIKIAGSRAQKPQVIEGSAA